MAITEYRDLPICRALQTRFTEQLLTEIEGRRLLAMEAGAGTFVCPYCWLAVPRAHVELRVANCICTGCQLLKENGY